MIFVFTSCCISLSKNNSNKTEHQTKITIKAWLNDTIYIREKLKDGIDTIIAYLEFENLTNDSLFLIEKPCLSIDKIHFLGLDTNAHYVMDEYDIKITNYEKINLIELFPKSKKVIKINLIPIYKYINVYTYIHNQFKLKNFYRFRINYINNKIKEINGRPVFEGGCISNYVFFHIN